MKEHNVLVLAVSEPFQDVEQIRRWVLCLHFPNFSSNVKVGGLHRLVSKLKRMKQRLRVWNKETFCRVDGIIRELEEIVEHYEELLQLDILRLLKKSFWFPRQNFKYFEQFMGTNDAVQCADLVRGGNVILKIEMSKSYDRVEWKFVDQALQAFGFPDFFCKVIQNCITTPWFPVMMHGTFKGFFKSKRGLRQGDHLSPYLFISMEDILSRMINKEMSVKHILPFSHPGGALTISHLLYGDDILIFANASKLIIQGLMKVLKKYKRCTRQRVNQEKSAIFFSKKLSLRRKNENLNETGLVKERFPFTYLEVSIVDGILKTLGLNKAEEVMERVGKLRNSKDVMLWLPEKNGFFNTKSV
ncbi:hypothetical protein Ddye_015347 [Dipteronia dyeriana]|uniref:Reverse transcriptase domain-containing protein n=1 Tax=Dipteronia dyeriana TaxID=168575 RepID=A0AAD9U5F1_9ROSI|nr:hypothetical protein Ddye_015347 [Dipteronia dyeriana]